MASKRARNSGRKKWGGRAGASLFNVWLNDDERAALDRISTAHDRPRSEVIRKLIAQEDAQLDIEDERGQQP